MIISILCLLVTYGILFYRKKKGKPLPRNVGRILLVVECMGLIASAFHYVQTEVTEVHQVKRPKAGEKDEKETYRVSGAGNQVILDTKLEDQAYSQKEMAGIFKKAEKEIDDTICGENKDLSHVERDLVLKESYQEGKVTAIYRSSNPDLILSSGKVTNAALTSKEEVTLTAKLSIGDVTESYDIAVIIYPANAKTKEGLEKLSQNAWKEINEKEGDKGKVTLPSSLGGEKVSWHLEKENTGLQLSILGLLAAIAIAAAGFYEKRRQEMERREGLKRDYPGLLNMLFLYVQSGIGPKSAMQRLAKDYIYRKNLGQVGTRPGYELMIRCVREMESGVGEGLAYENMGRYAGEQHFRKLSLLLVQNLKKGNGDLLIQLEREAKEAEETEKNQIRGDGEKISTKLLLPMMMLLGVVLVVLIFPAIHGMQANAF